MSKYGHRELTVQSGRPALSITVNYAMSFAKMVAAGRYDRVNDDITAKRFPVKGEGIKEFDVRLVHFDRPISSGDAVKEMDKMNLCPATHEKLLAFGAKYPDIQCEFRIVALGFSVRVGGSRSILCLSRGGSGRNLYLDWWSSNWCGGVRFLAVRK